MGDVNAGPTAVTSTAVKMKVTDLWLTQEILLALGRAIASWGTLREADRRGLQSALKGIRLTEILRLAPTGRGTIDLTVKCIRAWMTVVEIIKGRVLSARVVDNSDRIRALARLKRLRLLLTNYIQLELALM